MEILINSFQTIGFQLGVISNVFSHTWFILVPPLFYFLFFLLWMYHVQSHYWASADWVLLEIIPPREIEKSPKSMESLFVGFAGVEKTFNPLEEFTDGAFPDYMSLELVSIEGTVHFYMRSMKKYRHLIEAHLYAQYPDVEIIEVPDYVNDVPKIVPNNKWDLWGADIAPTAKHPAYPIRTYPSYEESVTGKMIDPLAGLIEVMGKIGPGQQMWLQWVIAPTSPSWNSKVGKLLAEKLKGKEKHTESILERFWKDFTDVFGNIFAGMKGPVEFAAEKKKDEQPLDTRLSPGERDVLKAVEENLGKTQFSTKGRFIYIGKRENFDKSLGVSAFWGGIKQFNDDNLNGLKPDGDSKTFANYVFKKSRLRYRQRKIFRRYRNRNRDGVMNFMSSEELATLYHLPDMQVLAPSITRVEAKRGGAPSNLPIE